METNTGRQLDAAHPIREIESDRGEFANDDDVARVVGKYVKATSRS